MRSILLSVGIGRYLSGSGFETISCAISDAVSVYDTLKQVMGAEFDEGRSGVVSDLSSSELRSLVESHSRALGFNERLILYFSGHAEVTSTSLALALADADEKKRGRVLVSELAALTRHAEAVYILDCCHAGDATGLANNTAILGYSRISVLAATGALESAAHGVEGSPFTNALCKHARTASLSGEALGLNQLAKLINDDDEFTGVSQVNVREGLSDLLLVTPARDRDEKPDVAHRFFVRLQESEAAHRELLWYMASALPLSAQGEIARAWARDELPGEAGWLVRRSMGTFLSGLPFGSVERSGLTHSFLESPNWMKVAVGLLGSRRIVGIEPYTSITKGLFSRPDLPMDVIWLCSLHLADAGIWQLDLVRGSALLSTSWGQIEGMEQVCRVSRDLGAGPDLVQDYADACRDSGASCVGLATYLCLQAGRLPQINLGTDPDTGVANDPLASYLFRRPSRGRLGSGAGKWLLSALYGNWRGEVRAELASYSDSVPRDAFMVSLARMRDLPSVALKMALLADPLLRNDEAFREVAIGWGLEDVHPWVRRAAVELAAGTGSERKALDAAIDQRLYPGLLDLLTIAGRFGVPWKESAAASTLTVVETSAVQRDVQE